jgi:hypothetical protein
MNRASAPTPSASGERIEIAHIPARVEHVKMRAAGDLGLMAAVIHLSSFTW